MEESILDVQLMNRPRTGQSQSENNSDSGRFDNRAESLIVVDAGPLSESPKNPTSLVMIKRAISQKFTAKDPFTSDEVDAVRSRDQVSGAIGLECIKLGLHRCPPKWISQGGAN